MRLPPEFEGRTKSAVGARLQISRHAYGLDQITFARKAGLKVSAYNQYERGVNLPKVEAGLAIKDQFRLTLDWIYDGDPSGLSHKLHDAIVSAIQLRIDSQ